MSNSPNSVIAEGDQNQFRAGDTPISDSSLPRVLVSTPYPFNTETGGGITLRSLFENWPKSHLAQIYGMGISPDEDVCHKNFSLNASTAEFVSTSVLWRMRRFGWFLTGKNELGGVWARLTPRLKEFVREFDPEIIFTQLGSLPQISLAIALSRFTKKPLAIHITDDWANGFYQGTDSVSRYLHRQLESGFRRALKLSSVRWGMSVPMAEAYERRYGGEWGYIYNPVIVERWPERARRTDRDKKFRLLYSGSIVGNTQQASLREVCAAVKQLGAEGMDIELNIHTFSQYLAQCADLQSLPFVRMHEQVPFEKLPEHLASADLLVLPVNFDQASFNYIRYSMPGKLSEYLMSGTPTLVYGPAEVVPVEYALREKWGQVVTQPGVEGLIKAIRELATNEELRAGLARRAREVGLKNHNAELIRSRFRQEISQGVMPADQYQRGSGRGKCEARSFA